MLKERGNCRFLLGSPIKEEREGRPLVWGINVGGRGGGEEAAVIGNLGRRTLLELERTPLLKKNGRDSWGG